VRSNATLISAAAMNAMGRVARNGHPQLFINVTVT
jgi:hypothetical protein